MQSELYINLAIRNALNVRYFELDKIFTRLLGTDSCCVYTLTAEKQVGFQGRESYARLKKPKEVIKEVIKEVPAEATTCPLFVTFAQGKADLTKDAKMVLDNVANGATVEIIGTASPEGSVKVNKQVSQIRANNVAKYLKSKGVVVKDATGKGVQGVTSNRLAVVYVK